MARAQDRRRMLQLVRAWEACGGSRRRFAARHGLTLWQLYYWGRQARARLAASAVAFAPVRVVESASRFGPGLELHLPTGDRLFIIPADAPPDLGRAVVTALRPSC